MRTRITTVGLAFILAATLLGGLAPVAHAVDGVVLIDQARALAGGITPGDAPGFPVTLSRSGSYRLSGNLTVPDENTTAIEITADNVTLDLNGFTILGPTVCSGTPLSCTPTGFGVGVAAGFQLNTTVVNGSVQGMGKLGVFANGLGSRVEKVHATSNGGTGISVVGTVAGNTATFNGATGIAASGTVTGNTAINNGGTGISADGTVTGNEAVSNGGHGIFANNSTVTGNAASSNGATGIAANASTVTGNTAIFNGSAGITASGTVTGNTVVSNIGLGLALLGQTGYALNVMIANSGGTVSGGVSLGHNLCNGVVC